MAWMITFEDGPNGPEMRADQDLMAAHWAYELDVKDKIVAAGSLRTDDGQTPIGGLLIVKTATKAEALELLENDPATKAGMRNNIQIKFWNMATLDSVVVA